MLDEAKVAVPDADVILFLVDGSDPAGKGDKWIAQNILQTEIPIIIVMNKVDKIKNQQKVEENLITGPVENSCLISLNSTFPHPLIAFLNEHPCVSTIHTCFSNQSAGFAATNSIIENKSLSKYKIIN